LKVPSLVLRAIAFVAIIALIGLFTRFIKVELKSWLYHLRTEDGVVAWIGGLMVVLGATVILACALARLRGPFGSSRPSKGNAP
jgi:hypothetical protein